MKKNPKSPNRTPPQYIPPLKYATEQSNSLLIVWFYLFSEFLLLNVEFQNRTIAIIQTQVLKKKVTLSTIISKIS